MLTGVSSKKYQTVLKEINSWSAEYKIRLLQDVLDLLKPVPEQDNVLAELRLSVAGKDYSPPRRISTTEATGIIPLAGMVPSLEEETEILTQALLEKYE